MYKFRDLKIRNKLRVLSILSFLSLITLGIVSNYFYNTGKTLSLIINAERVHNNTFQQGVESYYRYQVTQEAKWLDLAIEQMDAANTMAGDFGKVDQLAQLPNEEFVDILFDTYKEAYENDRSNAELMANRIKLLLILKPVKLLDAQKTAMNAYVHGELIKNKILDHKLGKLNDIEGSIEKDLAQFRILFGDFATAINSLINYTNNLLYIGIVFIVLLLLVTIASISTIISKSISIPVGEMVSKFRVIAKGNLNDDLTIESSNEIGELADSFRSIQDGLRDVIEYTKKVADGDYSSQIAPKSDEDEMSIALNKMVEKLKESHEKVTQESWFKSGLNDINAKLNSNKSLVEISNDSISFLMDFLHSQLGSIHLFNPDYQHLKLLSSSGFDPKKLKKHIKLNEGILGQVAFSKQLQRLNEIPGELYSTFSSTGEYRPKQIVVTPLMFNESLVGVLELSSLSEYTPFELEFLSQASEIIAIKLNSADSRIKTNELLQKTQDQASELQVQQEELRVANEELTEHTKILTENEKKLQVQQEELRVANEELEERTRQLEIQKEDISTKNTELTETHEKLEIKAKELQQASQYKSEFLANMSHELRTPLNSLLILSNLLANNKKGNLTADQIQSAKIIHKSGADLLHLINEILDLSKIEAGKMSLEVNVVSAEELKDEVLMNFNAMADDKNLKFEVKIDKAFPLQISTDRYRLMQVVKNLLSNAFKFTSQGKVAVDFIGTNKKVKFSSSKLSPENTCCVKISDTGVGIPAEKLESIFEAFQQADGSISRKFGGTGLGLSISRELIRMLGGEIQLESKVNEGSTFYVYLPVVLSENVEEVQLEQPEVVSDNALSVAEVEPIEKSQELIPFIDDDRNEAINGRTVLVIHPSKEQANKYLLQARAKDYKVIVAPNIEDGIILAEKYGPKAIMLAVEFANSKNPNYQKLKSHKLLRKLPVHVITPIDSDDEGEVELKTLETMEFADALKSIESQFESPLKKMLIVEDNAITRSVIKTMLYELNLDIKETQMAGEAYNILNYETFDCVILDLGLPDFSGMELLAKLKQNNVQIPKVIVYTGKEMTPEEIKELNGYTDTIILKGIKSDERLMDEVTLFLHQVSKRMPENSSKPSIANEESLFKGKKILVVDDDIRNVFALGQMLEERDVEVIEAENGQVAIDMLKENQNVDLVLMDVMMPVMDGYEAMRIIRNTPEVKNIPIICLTAKAMKEDHENALKNGANDYLSKPLNEEKLFSMLKIWLYKN
ncbi:response regulator [Sunxiuqinia sp. A32]|uniref:response regulator n=1 Tax=Sunxiuqinia sp. A32 TaxID=3461496 RepID=UPI004045404C